MRLENPFNKIKPIATAGVLTVGAFLATETQAQSGGVEDTNIPKIEIKNSTGKKNEENLKKLKEVMVGNTDLQIANLEKDIYTLSTKERFQEDLKIRLEESKNKALAQITLVEKLKAGIDKLTLTQKLIQSFIRRYNEENTALLEGVQDENIQEFYLNLNRLFNGNFNIKDKQYNFEISLGYFNLNNYSNSKELKSEFILLLDTYVAKLNQQYIAPYDTKEELGRYLENAWSGRENIEALREELSILQKNKEALNQDRTLEFFRDTVTSVYNETYRHFSSKEYLNKLSVEFGNEETARVHQEYRLRKLKDVSIEFEFDTTAFCRYYVRSNRIVFNFTRDLINSPSLETLSHEFSHLSDQGDEDLSDTAQVLYKDGWIGDTEFLKLRKEHPALFKDHPLNEKEDLEYYKDPTELNARKRVLELYMEKTGIKKYEEKMNDSHYEKLMQLLKDGELDRNSAQILLLILKDKLVEISNTIASSREDLKYIMGLVIEDKVRDPDTYYGMTDTYRGEILLVHLEKYLEKTV